MIITAGRLANHRATGVGVGLPVRFGTRYSNRDGSPAP